ncbi:class I SAM-dependent methyltransferase [Streptomyces tateyamensis]|uniref:class I SAM-dependent methyltransferase n=1 Tax=Streptomyces tateyamensis TaxID=565073 RepID=UPI001C64740B|nr:class I SAM-dependent methyltransferase [Streptomyces tateyamensis]
MTSYARAHWTEYNDAQQTREVRPLLREALALAGPGAGRTAIDLGCGLGRETDALLRAGYLVHAVDMAPDTAEKVRAHTRAEDQQRLTVHAVPFGLVRALPHAHLVYAGYSLPYADPAELPRLWALVRRTLRPGGWLAVNLFGEHDSYRGQQPGSYLTGRQIEELFDGLEVVRLDEQDADGDSFRGPKHWHLFDVIARRPLGS